MEERIQRKRTKGWKMPKHTVYVGRPSMWGNPFVPSNKLTVEYTVNLYKECISNNAYAYCIPALWLLGAVIDNKKITEEDAKMPEKLFNYFRNISENLYKLKGKNLACWCRLDQPCHADVLLELANKFEFNREILNNPWYENPDKLEGGQDALFE
jgi:hypothetical protein